MIPHFTIERMTNSYRAVPSLFTNAENRIVSRPTGRHIYDLHYGSCSQHVALFPRLSIL